MTTSELEQESLGHRASRGLRWSLIGTTVTKIGSFALGIALARLLTPDDFGVYAIGLAALYFLMHVNDLGLIAATVQWRGRLAEMAPTATTIAAVSSIAIYIGFWFAAPAIAAIADVPQATPVLRLVAVVMLIDGLTAVRSGALMRRFQQDRLIVSNLLGLLVNAAVAISLAIAGAGPFSFAGGQVAGALVTGLVVTIAARLPLRVGFDPAVARRLMVYGLPLAGSLAVEAFLMNADYVIIGRITSDVAALGYYLLAFNISTWAVSIISTAVGYVSVAGFSRLSERSTERLSAGVQRTVPLLVAVAVPIATVTAVLATPLVTVVYGDRWQPAAVVLQFLAVLTVVRMLTSFTLEVLMGAGATRSTLWVNLGWAAALVPALIVGTNLDGIRGAAIAHGAVGLLVATPLVLVALHRAGVRLAPIAPALVRPLAAGAVAAAATALVAHLLAEWVLLQLTVAGVAGLLAYVALVAPPRQLRAWYLMIKTGRTS